MQWSFRRKTKRKQTAEPGGNQGGMGCPSHRDKDPSKLPQCQTEGAVTDIMEPTASLLYPIIKRKITVYAFVVFSQEDGKTCVVSL